MKRITLRTKITLILVGLLTLTGIFYAASPTQFATVGDPMAGNIPIGVAASSSKLLVTEYTNQNIDIIDDNGAVSLWATIPNFQGNAEKYIAISQGFGQWDPDNVYVTQGADIYKFKPDGTTSATPFVTLQDNQGHGCGFDETGITFDQVGTFGYDMILTCVTGDVWRVNPAGTPTWVTNTGTELEGPAVAPQNFGPYGGQIWAADEDNSKVYAIGSAGSVHNVVTWQGAEGVLVVPSNPCAFASGILFSARHDQNAIYKFSQNDPAFTSLGGNILVTSETGHGIGLITTDGTSYSVTLFDNSILGAEYEGSAFVDCQTGAPTPAPTATFTPTATATATATPTATSTPTPTPTPTATPMQFFTSFVIGDLDAVVGNHVTFWGSQWWKQNHFSRGGSTASFKGFANSPNPNPSTCGGTWRSDPGNSSGPPASVPADIIVMVSSIVTKSGSVISGDVPKMVIVHTDPGYGPAPGHDGTGTVTAVVCQQ